jgi:hypothetical protein
MLCSSATTDLLAIRQRIVFVGIDSPHGAVTEVDREVPNVISARGETFLHERNDSIRSGLTGKKVVDPFYRGKNGLASISSELSSYGSNRRLVTA